ncbi:hypothetical protein GY15_08875 [Delftia sp. 670]|nr:hypothetical protein GY15_08875 [Delftia sp. 670]
MRQQCLYIGVGRMGAQGQQHVADIDAGKVQLLQRRGVGDEGAGLELLQDLFGLAGLAGEFGFAEVQALALLLQAGREGGFGALVLDGK